MPREFDLLHEDTYMYGNKWTGGIQNRSLKPNQITIADALKDADRRLASNKAGNVNPYPSEGIEEKMADVVIRIEECRILLEQTLENPLVKDENDNKRAVKEAIKELSSAEKSIDSTVKMLDKIMN